MPRSLARQRQPSLALVVFVSLNADLGTTRPHFTGAAAVTATPAARGSRADDSTIVAISGAAAIAPTTASFGRRCSETCSRDCPTAYGDSAT